MRTPSCSSSPAPYPWPSAAGPAPARGGPQPSPCAETNISAPVRANDQGGNRRQSPPRCPGAAAGSRCDDFSSPPPSKPLNPATSGGNMTTATTGIQAISLVMVPTSDQDRSIEFYEKIGFEKRTDVPFGGGYRWVELYPPAGTTGIALAPPRPGEDVE